MATLDLFAGKGERPDAVFVASDHMAFAVMDTLRHELGLRVPEDVSVVGFDNVPQAAWPSYRLTTVEQPLGPMIEATVDLLQRHLRQDAHVGGENVTVPGELIIRGSVRSAAVPSKAGERRRRITSTR
jgi:DNA-binding LacI/PurR family transcriptional regulator